MCACACAYVYVYVCDPSLLYLIRPLPGKAGSGSSADGCPPGCRRGWHCAPQTGPRRKGSKRQRQWGLSATRWEDAGGGGGGGREVTFPIATVRDCNDMHSCHTLYTILHDTVCAPRTSLCVY